MKYIANQTAQAALALSAGLALTAGLCFGAPNFTTGQAARLLIGQTTFTSQISGASSTLIGAAGGLAFVNDTLIVVDANRLSADPVNNRVLLFQNLSRTLPKPTDELFYTQRCPICAGEATVVLGQPDFTSADLKTPSASTLRTPVGAASDGVYLAVADSDNNRVLIWNKIPQTNFTPADVVLGQSTFARFTVNDGTPNSPTAKSMRGPQGVWIQNGKLFVADTGNNRVLIWNSMPRTNQQPADLVVGAPDFTTFVQQDLTKVTLNAQQNNMLTPVAVTSDGIRMVVSDLGHNRVLIWNTIPTKNGQQADVVVGQPLFTEAAPNNSSLLCDSTGKDANNADVFPALCESTLNFPRYALSDGQYLFVADGGNDRVLVYNSIPTTNGARADAILGQIGGKVNVVSDNGDPNGIASAGVVRTPLSLAWDAANKNLFVSDPYNRRIMIFTMGERKIPNTGVRNAASRDVFAVGSVNLSGTVVEGQTLTLTITTTNGNGVDDKRDYAYKVKKNDGFVQLINGVLAVVNAGDGDPRVFASPNFTRNAIILTAKVSGDAGNAISYSTKVDGDTTLVAATAAATLAGGQDAAKIAPGAIVSIFGDDLAETTVGIAPNAQTASGDLGNVQVYFDGVRAPLLYVSPTEIRAQIPWEFIDTQSINAYVRTKRSNGDVTVTTAIAVPIILQNPGIFAQDNARDPRPAIAMHGSPYATGTVSVDGSINAGDTGTITISDRNYTYTVVSTDTLETVRDAFIRLINDGDPEVQASPAAAFTRIRLRARKAGAEGNGITYTASVPDGSQVILTPTTPNLCCANSGPITEANPALPGETIILTGTGLGLVLPDEARLALNTGRAYNGPALNDPVEFVSSLAGGKTANVLSAGLKPGTIGLYEIVLELNSDLPTDSTMQVTIAQDIYVSNIVTIPLFNPTQTDTP